MKSAFDVDGAYNSYYEIIKKRLDKAHIKDSPERITAPEKLPLSILEWKIRKNTWNIFTNYRKKAFCSMM
jgi:hypothetical protein